MQRRAVGSTHCKQLQVAQTSPSASLLPPTLLHPGIGATGEDWTELTSPLLRCQEVESDATGPRSRKKQSQSESPLDSKRKLKLEPVRVVEAGNGSGAYRSGFSLKIIKLGTNLSDSPKQNATVK